MKNKEIEELLKGMKDVSNTEGCSMNLDRYLVKLLLSYIEQLEKRNKELYEGFMATQEELTDYATKNEQLEKELQNYKDLDISNMETIECQELEIVNRENKITQLEKDKKELKDGWQQDIYDKNKVLNDWLEDERKINVLQNNRDKAIEYVEDNYDKVTRIEFDNGYVKETRYENNFSVEILFNILKGDSDE